MTHLQEATKGVPTENIARLSVQISLTGLSFLLEYRDSESWLHQVKLDQGLHPGDLLLKLRELYEREPRLKSKADKVVVIYHHKTFSWVPKALFNPDNLSDYLKYNTKLLAQDYLDYDALESKEMVNVYVPYTNINNYFFDRYGDFTFLHSSTVFLAAISNRFAKAQVQVVAHLEDATLMLGALSQNKVLLINSYSVTSPEDFAYYLLFIMEQLQLKGEDVQLTLSGPISKEDDYYLLAYRYVKEVDLLEDDQQPFLLKNVDLACE